MSTNGEVSGSTTAAGDESDEVPADVSDGAPEPPRPFRVMPAVLPENEHFWLGGAEGELRILRCQTCGYWIHPPAPICPSCLGRDLAPEATSGRAVVHTFTVNWQPWYPNLDPPYLVAIVALPEQEGLRLTTNLVGVDPDDVRIGSEVEVVFEHYDGVWLPFFTPVGSGAGAGAGAVVGSDGSAS